MPTWKGIDVSRSQGWIDWSKVKKNIDFAIIKLGYIGNSEKLYLDSNFYNNAKQCEKLGIPYGVYVYSYATSADAINRDMPVVLSKLAGRRLTLPVYLDLEESRIASSGKENILKMSKAFCQAVEKAGLMAGIYANLSWFRTFLTDSWYQTKSLWIAQYNKTCDYKGKKEMWQYTSSGKVPGIKTKVDLNIMYRSPIIGDVNDDGKVDAKDKERILKASANLVKLTEHQKAKADVNKDGKINAQDAAKIK